MWFVTHWTLFCWLYRGVFILPMPCHACLQLTGFLRGREALEYEERIDRLQCEEVLQPEPSSLVCTCVLLTASSSTAILTYDPLKPRF